MKKVLLGICLIVMLLFVVGCKRIGKNKAFYLSNPTNQKIKVKVDGREYNLSPQSFQKLKLKAGEHDYEYDTQKVKFIITFDAEGGIINPTKSTYILANLVYETENSQTNFVTRINEITINGVKYEVPGSLINDEIIDNKFLDFEFKLDEPFPKSVKNLGNSDGNIYTKIFTIKDFVKFYEDETGETGNYENIEKATKFEISGTYYNEDSFNALYYKIPDYKTPGLKEAAQKVIDLDKEYGNAAKVSEQKRISKEMKKVWKEYVQILMKKVDEDKNINDVLSIKNIGKGVIIK